MASGVDAKPRTPAENSDIDPKGFPLSAALLYQAIELATVSLIY
jgi:hypothetical protein